jgi:hypothetical protein
MHGARRTLGVRPQACGRNVREDGLAWPLWFARASPGCATVPSCSWRSLSLLADLGLWPSMSKTWSNAQNGLRVWERSTTRVDQPLSWIAIHHVAGGFLPGVRLGFDRLA